MAAGLPNSSLYRPHLSRQAIELHGKEEGVLFDPCCGWGGRLLGTVSKGWKYIGCEPNPTTFVNLQRMVRFLKDNFNLPEIEIHNIPVEEYVFQDKHDVVLTSPPYFDLEVYSVASNQSYNKFSTYETWMEQWLEPLIYRCLDNMHEGGLSCWNVMNFQSHNIVDKVIEIHGDRGYNVSDTLGFSSPLANIRSLKNKDVTYLFR